MTPRAFVEQRRVARAKRLIDDSPRSLADVSICDRLFQSEPDFAAAAAHVREGACNEQTACRLVISARLMNIRVFDGGTLEMRRERIRRLSDRLLFTRDPATRDSLLVRLHAEILGARRIRSADEATLYPCNLEQKEPHTISPLDSHPA